MKVNDYLGNNKEKWMNGELLNAVASNPKLQRLFMNREYMHDI